MRFRKIRSFLSAYSNDELSDRKQNLVREELATKESLRREEALFRSIRDTARELPELKTSDDFNARLLNRIAQERFAETRTKAYLPRTSPPISWGRLIPAVATVTVMLFAAVSFFGTSDRAPVTLADSTSGGLSNLHLTVQPENNPNLRRGFGGDVSLQQLMAKIDRADEISSFLTSSGMFLSGNGSNGSNWLASSREERIPYSVHYYQVRPVLRVSRPVTAKQEDRVY